MFGGLRKRGRGKGAEDDCWECAMGGGMEQGMIIEVLKDEGFCVLGKKGSGFFCCQGLGVKDCVRVGVWCG